MNRHERRAAKAQAKSAKLDRVVAVHEAGHAVGRILSAGDMGLNPTDAIAYIDIAPDTGPMTSFDKSVTLKSQATTFGPMISREIQAVWDRRHADISKDQWNLSAMPEVIKQAKDEGADIGKWLRAKMLMTVLGSMAEAKLTGKHFQEVWDSYECEQDVKDAVRDGVMAGLETPEISAAIDAAMLTASELIAQPNVWKAITALADRLPSHGRMLGPQASAIVLKELGPDFSVHN